MTEDQTTYDKLTDAEWQWMESQESQFQAYVEALIPDHQAEAPNAEMLDALWKAWFEAEATDAEAVNAFAQAYSVAFGQVLCRELGFEWTIATDEYGTELAVRNFPGTANLRVFPGDFVAKRYERQEGPFVSHAVEQIAKSVEKSAEDWGNTGAA